MKVIIVKDYAEMSDRAAEIVIKAVVEEPDIVLGLATAARRRGSTSGSSPPTASAGWTSRR